MKKILIILPFIISSCVENSDGSTSSTALIIIIIFVFIGLILAVANTENENEKKIENQLKKEGLKRSDLIKCGNCVGGHPDINNEIKDVLIYVKDGFLWLICINDEKGKVFKETKIPISSITDINIEDATSIENKITLGRVFLVGIFALAWKKKKKNELAFVTILWRDGKFEHTTIFSFDGNDAMNRANTCRNKLVKQCQDDEIKKIDIENTPIPLQASENHIPDEEVVMKKLSIADEIIKLKQLLDSGTINPEEFKKLKDKLLNN